MAHPNHCLDIDILVQLIKTLVASDSQFNDLDLLSSVKLYCVG